jgi:hypothetical protein
MLAAGRRYIQKAFHLTPTATLSARFFSFGRVLTCAPIIVQRADTRKREATRMLRNFVACLVVTFSLPTFSAGETSTAASAKSGRPNRSVRNATIHWERVPLRDAVGRLNELFDEPIFVDRRVDPTLRISLNVDGATLPEVLERLAASASLGVSELPPLHYLGPRSAADQLRTVATVRREEVGRLPAARRGALERKQALTWPRITEPRKLISALVERRGWRVGGAERIPHDLWPAGELPALALGDQLTVLLIGFDLTFEAKAAEQTLNIVPLKTVTLNRRYRLQGEFSNPDALLQQVPAAQARVEGATISVDARLEDHEQLAEILRGRAARARRAQVQRAPKQVYTLRVQEQPVGAVLNELGARLGWSIEIDSQAIRAAGLSLEKRISFSVANSDQNALLDALLRPAGLNYRREGEKLLIVPRGSGED